MSWNEADHKFVMLSINYYNFKAQFSISTELHAFFFEFDDLIFKARLIFFSVQLAFKFFSNSNFMCARVGALLI